MAGTTVGEALAVTTRAQVKTQEEAEARCAAAEGASGAAPHSLFEEETVVSQNATEESSHLTQGEGEEVLEDGDVVELEEVVEPEELEDTELGTSMRMNSPTR